MNLIMNKDTVFKYLYIIIIIVLVLLNFNWVSTVDLIDGIYNYIVSNPSFYEINHPNRAMAVRLIIPLLYILTNYFISYKVYILSKQLLNKTFKTICLVFVVINILLASSFFIIYL
jgi:hypothetical protein